MEEVLNQELTSDITTDDVFSDNEGEDLFSDAEPTSEVEEIKEEPKEEPIEVENKPFLEIQYNKEVKGLSQEEAKSFAQKGMNYDKIANNYNELKGELEKLASANGMSMNDYLVQLQSAQHEMEIGRELDALKEKYPEGNEEVLNELAKQIVENKSSAREQNAIKAQQEQANARELEVKKQIEEFKSIYPDVNPDDIPDEVIEMAQNGKTLLGAYVTWNKTQQAKNSEDKVAKQNEENKKRSLGNITNAGDEAPDDFFSGFNSI